jgi:hypothetical protein
MYVRIDALGEAGLTADQMLDAVVMAVRELGIVMGLQTVHGREAGLRRYFEIGGHVRFTSWGDPYVPVYKARRRSK